MESISTPMSLNHCFQCYESSFSPAIAEAGNEFLGAGLKINLVSASYEPAFFLKHNDYFVTQVNHTPEFSLVMKISDTAADLMLTRALGKRREDPGDLKLKDITGLEAEILSAYTEFVYNGLSGLLLDKKEINSILHTLENEKTVYLTFYIRGNPEYEAGMIVLSFPEFIFRKMQPVLTPEQLVEQNFFNESRVETSVLIGKTRASLDDIKGLEPEDIIILENSDLYRMYLKEYEDININVNPSHSLVLDFEEENGDDDIVNEARESNVNIWDTLEVDVTASFEKIKMKLGDLREITEGLVVDVASIANNKVFVEVENRHLATGELVIIGDKYGVRITEISTEAKSREVEMLEEQAAEKQDDVSAEAASAESSPEEADEDLEIQEDLEDSDFEIEENSEEEDEY